MKIRSWLPRLLIGTVLVMNVQCALWFIFDPGGYAPSFELSGPVGEASVRGMGVLFVMWNVPYAVACLEPFKRRISLYEALAMQAIGVAGESLILWRLPAGHAVLAGSLLRFILFDAAGLLVLGLAAWSVHGLDKNS